ncbi:hypothetical protein C8R48DRAFT_670752 [Suillus tomentosus]|nr:hypothetical protein C8R48DRAFT_670752 [Suillus tomentosus]
MGVSGMRVSASINPGSSDSKSSQSLAVSREDLAVPGMGVVPCQVGLNDDLIRRRMLDRPFAQGKGYNHHSCACLIGGSYRGSCISSVGNGNPNLKLASVWETTRPAAIPSSMAAFRISVLVIPTARAPMVATVELGLNGSRCLRGQSLAR